MMFATYLHIFWRGIGRIMMFTGFEETAGLMEYEYMIRMTGVRARGRLYGNSLVKPMNFNEVLSLDE